MRLPSLSPRSPCSALWRTFVLGSLLLQAEALKFTVSDWTVVTGVPFLVTWTGSKSGESQTLTLQNGTIAAASFVGNVTTNIYSNAYTWTPGNKAIVGNEYFLKIEDTSGASAYGDKFTVLKTAPSSTSSTSTSSPTSSSTSSPASSPTSSPTPSSSSGLSTGAKAGIGIGAAIGGIAVIGILAFFVLRARKAKGREVKQGMGAQELTADDVKKDKMELNAVKSPVEMPTSERQEMEGASLRAEMPG